MPESIPKNIKLTLCIFKALNNAVCESICKLVMLLWREFYIAVTVEIEIKSFTLRVKRKGKELISQKFEKPREIKKVLKDLVKEHCIQLESIKEK